MVGCKQSTDPSKLRLHVKNQPSDNADKLKWRWSKGAAVDATELANPVDPPPQGGDHHALCFYDESGPTPVLVYAAMAVPNLQCNDDDWYKVSFNRLRYERGDGTPHGLRKLLIVAGGDRRSKVILKGKGTHLTDGPLGPPPLPLPLPLRVELQAENGTCWTGVFTAEGMQQNDGAQFKGSGG
jgi:hypothetical protein